MSLVSSGAAPVTAALLAAGALVLALRPPLGSPHRAVRPSSRALPLRRWRPVLVLLATCAGPAFLPTAGGWVLGVALGAATWWGAGRDPGDAARCGRIVAELPDVVRLLAIALVAGAPPATALGQVAEALPGPAADLLRLARSRLELGVPPQEVWSELAGLPGLEPLGRALGRAHRSGGSVAVAATRLADELAREARSAVEDRARTVGIRAAVPLGVCFLPAFLLVGIVPVVAAAARGLGW